MTNDVPRDLVNWAIENDASAAFVACLMIDSPTGRHHPRRKAARAKKGGRQPPATWGHFLTALWDGDIEKAWARADSGNSRLMQKAGAAIQLEGEPNQMVP